MTITQQVTYLIELGYPKLLNISETKFREKFSKFEKLPDENLEEGKLPFVIVVQHPSLSPEKMMQLVCRNDMHGVTKLNPYTSADFKNVNGAENIKSQYYVLRDIERGGEYRNVTPFDALTNIQSRNGLPLTIYEGISIITQYPEFLVKNNCFSLLASRVPNDKRVPAIWINAEKAPNLGWCWEKNPHTWLGSASCGKRLE